MSGFLRVLYSDSFVRAREDTMDSEFTIVLS